MRFHFPWFHRKPQSNHVSITPVPEVGDEYCFGDKMVARRLAPSSVAATFIPLTLEQQQQWHPIADTTILNQVRYYRLPFRKVPKKVSCLTCDPTAPSGYESCEVCRPSAANIQLDPETVANDHPAGTPTSDGHFVGCPPDCHQDHPTHSEHLFPEAIRLMRLRHQLERKRDFRNAGTVGEADLKKWIDELREVELELYSLRRPARVEGGKLG